jgi:AraC family ethanolamine operon transcriptional activator
MKDLIHFEIEDYLKNMAEFDMEVTQLSPGKFVCCQKELTLPKLIIGYRFVNTSLLHHSCLKQDCFYIIIPKGNSGMSVNGQKILLNQPLIYTLEQEVISCIPDNSYNLYIIIPTAELAKYFDKDKIEKFKKSSTQQSSAKKIFLQSESNQNNLCSLIEALLKRSELLSNQAVLDNQETIIELLCDFLILNLPLPQKNNISQKSRLAIVNRALKHIHKSITINITSPYLAEVSFCSLRSLEYAFKSVLNMRPKQYLIKRRLQLINSTLKSNRKVLISDTMKNFGILNQGRFAQDYFKFYNEYPHQTRNVYINQSVDGNKVSDNSGVRSPHLSQM